jgi:signal transduction histidine kinase
MACPSRPGSICWQHEHVVTDDPRQTSPLRFAFGPLVTRARRLLAFTTVLLLVVGAVGTLLERRRLGRDDADASAKVAGEVRASFEAMAAALGRVAQTISSDEALQAAPRDAGAQRRLFATLAAAVASPAEGELAATVVTSEGQPLAWAGRPSELPASRIAGPEALLIAPGQLGPRLVVIKPVLPAGIAKGPRVATVIVERLLPSIRTEGDPVSGSFVMNTSVVPVAFTTRHSGAGSSTEPSGFIIRGLDGAPLLEARVRQSDIAAARASMRSAVLRLMLVVLGLGCALLQVPLGEWRARARSNRGYAAATLLAAACVFMSRALLWWADPASLADDGPASLFAATPLAPALLVRSALDFLLTATAALGLVAIAASAADRARLVWRPSRAALSVAKAGRGVALLVAAAAVAAILASYQWFLGATVSNASLDVLRFSLHPWSLPRLELAAALVVSHATVLWACSLLLRVVAAATGLTRRAQASPALAMLWAVPLVVGVGWAAWARAGTPAVGLWLPGVLVVGQAMLAPRLARRYRHASQVGRLLSLFAALALPACAIYPSLFVHAEGSKRHLVETRFARQAVDQRDELQRAVGRALDQIDGLRGLPDLLAAPTTPGVGPVSTDAAFLIWTQTDLAALRLTSAIELYGRDGALVSRFALNLPEYTSTQQTWQEPGCAWDQFEEVSPFGSEERRLLHAGRGICESSAAGAPRPVGAIVIHSMLDYGTLPFITSRNPYAELLRAGRETPAEGTAGQDIEFVLYGWSRRSVYVSGSRAWPLDDPTFERAYASRQPFWVDLEKGGRRFHVFLSNDRGGIYAVGYPAVSLIGHLINIAELGTLAGTAYLALLVAVVGGGTLAGRRAQRGRELLNEIRASFYRKLLLSFVAAAVIPVLTLAFVARAYMTARMRADIEDAAIRTTEVAQRVVEETSRLQERATGPLTLDDDVLVWLGRALDQDVNVFDGSRLVATSERDLFASGLLPTRTSADVYRAIALDRRAGFVGVERAGSATYMLAAAPVRAGGREAILTVPLALRQQAIEREIDDLTRRILLAVVGFILMGSALGYWMAERIADPVNRLRRATARIARGDLNARVALTSSDELRRLVDAFNRMATELQRQQVQLERTHRLEAWADMARQVAHEIKNPLTPIQLSAEHLRRVHVDRGTPMSPVLESCVDSILTQVRLLRQIAGEFSAFASAPTARPVETEVAHLVGEVLEPYRAGLSDRVRIHVSVPADLPPVWIDRALVGRALTNLLDNALHAMPGVGDLRLAAGRIDDGRAVEISVSDSGVGMDSEALSRVFEPYFSTKAIGTGLGLTIAKRNVELNGGTIRIASAPGQGTTVTLTVPAAGVGPGHASEPASPAV